MRHTPKLTIDLSLIIPELASLGRETVRLHPRRGECADYESKIGGEFIWPENEPWPHCEEHNCPYVTVLQLRRSDVPELGFRNGNDLFQLLWCPNDHETAEPLYAPKSQLFWRKQLEVGPQRATGPETGEHDSSYVPTSCVLHPERVVEYPNTYEVHDSTPDLWNKIVSCNHLKKLALDTGDPAIEDAASLYQYWLSVADGTKVGGYPNWIQGQEVPECRCGKQMEYLLTIADSEFDGATWGRWLVTEDRPVWSVDYEKRAAVQCAANLSLGDMGNMNFFICRNCDEWPVGSVFQCS